MGTIITGIRPVSGYPYWNPKLMDHLHLQILKKPKAEDLAGKYRGEQDEEGSSGCLGNHLLWSESTGVTYTQRAVYKPLLLPTNVNDHLWPCNHFSSTHSHQYYLNSHTAFMVSLFKCIYARM